MHHFFWTIVLGIVAYLVYRRKKFGWTILLFFLLYISVRSFLNGITIIKPIITLRSLILVFFLAALGIISYRQEFEEKLAGPMKLVTKNSKLPRHNRQKKRKL
jgi:hypothetical protein